MDADTLPQPPEMEDQLGAIKVGATETIKSSKFNGIRSKLQETCRAGSKLSTWQVFYEQLEPKGNLSGSAPNQTIVVSTFIADAEPVNMATRLYILCPSFKDNGGIRVALLDHTVRIQSPAMEKN